MGMGMGMVGGKLKVFWGTNTCGGTTVMMLFFGMCDMCRITGSILTTQIRIKSRDSSAYVGATFAATPKKDDLI